MIEARPELRDLPPVVHGGDAPPGVLDFSTGVSPLPAPPRILEAVRAADLSRYPHPTAQPLREKLAPLHDARPDELVAGAGSVELIWALARAFAGPGRRGVVFGPAFGEYEQALRASGAEVGGAIEGASIAFLCRPGNPTLAVPPAGEIAALAARNAGTLVVVDEAYLPMFDDAAPVARAPNVAVLRSMTKLFALPGLRLGYLIAHGRRSPACASAT
jgi:histidinol-phosphate/aromatic aminotransferase/cobyric acid decarboxylase-like protein